MSRIERAVLSAAVAAALAVGAAAVGCYPPYGSLADIQVDDLVSQMVTETVDGATTTNTYNYECHASVWCNSAGFEPGGAHSSSAWTPVEVCNTSEPILTREPPAEWDKGGCPDDYAPGAEYEGGDAAAVPRDSYTMVYECRPAPLDQSCGRAGYEPGTGQYWELVWEEVGSCNGTLAPTATPSWVEIEDAGGCPPDWDDATEYEEGDRVHARNIVFQCRPHPYSMFCGNAERAPLADADNPDYWREVWDVVGHCNGTIIPTASPTFGALELVGACPDEWEAKTVGEGYEEGDRVSDGVIVYSCKAWPDGGRCGQEGYRPGDDAQGGTPGAWRDAWEVEGYCDGSAGPTMTPTFDPANVVGACPDEWEAGSNTKYEEGDAVSVAVSEAPPRRVAFKCKAWPYSGHCGQHSPLDEGGSLGWTLEGPCDGSTGPTMSPTFGELEEFAGGCPPEYSDSSADYRAGDLVSSAVSEEPERRLVFECREGPSAGYCTLAAFAPLAEHGDMAWIERGYCVGTMVPTFSPTPFAGACPYEKCNMDPETKACVPTAEEAVAWSGSTAYEAGDVVRVGALRFACREWPNVLWCPDEAYRPTSDGRGIWKDAWRKDGTCV